MRELSRGEFNVEDAWNVHLKTRGKNEERNVGELHIQKIELQEKLDNYRKAGAKDFDITISELEQPKDFIANRKFNGDLDNIPDARWYSSLERMRAYELKKHFESALCDIQLPNVSEGKKICFTDVGSRSNFFGALMGYFNKDQNWKMVDIENKNLPAKVQAEGRCLTVAPFEELPKSDVITLNSVLHHVGEMDNGKFDNDKIENFLGTVHNALPKDGLVIVVEDFVGKDKIENSYNDFIKGLDMLFYPKALGNQKPSKEWINIMENNGFSLVKESYPIGFNVVGFPVVETCLVFRKK